MKSDSTRGWKKVFGFTFVQYVKTKTFIVGTIVLTLIMILLVAGVNILPKLMSSEESSEGGSTAVEDVTLTKVYIADSTDTLTDEDLAAFAEAGFPQPERTQSITELIGELSSAEQGQALVTVTAEEYTQEDGTTGGIEGYTIKTYYSPQTDTDSADALSNTTALLLKYRNMLNIGVQAEDLAVTERYYSVYRIEAGADEWSLFESLINYIVPIVFSLILFIFIFAYGQSVAQSIATEKTSRVMELLLTSIRPLAVVIGKVLAMCLVSIIQALFLGAMGVGTFFATASFGIGGELIKMMQNPAEQTGQNAEIAQALSGSFDTLTPLTFVLILVIFILGFLFFALIAALVGASVSRMEDLAQAMQPYSLLGILGFYLAYFPVMFNTDSFANGSAATNPMQIFSYYFPVSSPFSLPSALLLGTLSTGQVIIAALILAAFVALVAVIVARVYEMIILHSGSRLKMKDILSLAVAKR